MEKVENSEVALSLIDKLPPELLFWLLLPLEMLVGGLIVFYLIIPRMRKFSDKLSMVHSDTIEINKAVNHKPVGDPTLRENVALMKIEQQQMKEDISLIKKALI